MRINFRKLLTVSLLAVLAFCLSGCVRSNIDITVNKDGTANVSLLYASISPEGSPASDESAQQYEAAGWTAEKYLDGDYSGYTYTIENAPLSSDLLQDENGFKVTRDGSNYVIDFYPIPEDQAVDMTEYAPYFKEYDGYLKCRISLPVKPKTHNAQVVSEDGKTLEWDILQMDYSEPIHVEFSLADNTIYFILAGVAIAILLVVAILIALKRKKAKQ